MTSLNRVPDKTETVAVCFFQKEWHFTVGCLVYGVQVDDGNNYFILQGRKYIDKIESIIVMA